MHPMFAALYLETDAEDLLAEEQDRRRRQRSAGRARSAQVIRTAASPDRPRRA